MEARIELRRPSVLAGRSPATFAGASNVLERVMELDLREATDAAERAAREAGAVLLEWRGRFTVREKRRADLVTEADFASQRLIRESLAQRYPVVGFLGEEAEAPPAPPLQGAESRSPAPRGTARAGPGRGGPFRWIVDPLDGTTNYVHGVPFFCVSIGLERDGRVLVGVIYEPVRDECFRAFAGGGAWLGAERLHVSDVETLRSALVAFSMPPGVGPDDPEARYFTRMLSESQSLRRTGSSALNLAYVAAGRFDAFWGTALNAWDAAAGLCLVEEAGGKITRFDGSPWVLEGRAFAASNGTRLHVQVLARLATGSLAAQA